MATSLWNALPMEVRQPAALSPNIQKADENVGFQRSISGHPLLIIVVTNVFTSIVVLGPLSPSWTLCGVASTLL